MLDVCTGIALFIIETHKNTITKTSKKIVLVFLLRMPYYPAPGPSVFVLSFARLVPCAEGGREDSGSSIFLPLSSSSVVILSVSTLNSVTENE